MPTGFFFNCQAWHVPRLSNSRQALPTGFFFNCQSPNVREFCNVSCNVSKLTAVFCALYNVSKIFWIITRSGCSQGSPRSCTPQASSAPLSFFLLTFIHYHTYTPKKPLTLLDFCGFQNVSKFSYKAPPFTYILTLAENRHCKRFSVHRSTRSRPFCPNPIAIDSVKC